MHRLTLGSRKTFLTFAVHAAVLIRNDSPVQRYQFGVTCGPPRKRFVARTALGMVFRNSACRSGLGLGTINSLRLGCVPRTPGRLVAPPGHAFGHHYDALLVLSCVPFPRTG